MAGQSEKVFNPRIGEHIQGGASLGPMTQGGFGDFLFG